jgi:hypothetical protein
VTYEGETRATPFTVTAVAGGARAVIAPAVQAGWHFIAWADGGPRERSLVIPAAARAYTATYGLPAWLPLLLNFGSGFR